MLVFPFQPSLGRTSGIPWLVYAFRGKRQAVVLYLDSRVVKVVIICSTIEQSATVCPLTLLNTPNDTQGACGVT